MSWLKNSDTAHSSPMVLAPIAWEREDLGIDPWDLLTNTLYGLVQRCATHSAGYDTDYVISDATVASMAQPARDWRRLADLAARAGYWSRAEDDGGWLLIQDSEHFVHIRLKAEKEWEAQRKKDNGNPDLIVPVRMRDGDGCRYCGHIVDWRSRRGNRAGTYDHRVPGEGARGPDDLFVCCGRCNSTRGANQAEFDTRHPRLPAPATPHFGELTVQLLADHGITVPCSAAPSRPRTRRDPAARTATRPPGGHRSTTDRDPAPGGPPQHEPRPANQADTAPSMTATPHPAGPRTDVEPPGPAPSRPATQADPAPSTPPPDPAPGGPPRASPGHSPPAARPADPGRFRQVGGVRELGLPGRVGNGSGWAGTGVPAQPIPPNPVRKPRGRRGRSYPQPPGNQEHMKSNWED